VLTARREIERLDVLLMQISLVAGRRHRAASRRARLSAARLHAAKR